MTSQWMDRYFAAAELADPADRAAIFTALDGEAQSIGDGAAKNARLFNFLISQQAASERMGEIFVGLLYSRFTAVGMIEEGQRAYRPLTSVGLALAHYKAERRSFPDRLQDLVPDYVASVPIDPHSEKPFRYRKTEEGYRLYSVGINGKDDGGKTYNNDDRSDDLLIEVPWKPKAKPVMKEAESVGQP
jgi:hypothetical protein